MALPAHSDESAFSRNAVLNEDGRTLNIHYTDSGHRSPSAPVVALLHGSGPGSTGWSNFATNRPALASAGLRVICIDLPGWGRSDSTVCVGDRSALNARALSAVLDAAGTIERSRPARVQGFEKAAALQGTDCRHGCLRCASTIPSPSASARSMPRSD